MLSLRKIAAEWNRNASARCQQLDARLDVSHDKVLLPVILRLAGDLREKQVLDAGCGCGFLTRAVARQAKGVIGIDISAKMIKEAKRRFEKVSNIRFEVISVEAFARVNRNLFDICVCNMSLMTMPQLDRALCAMAAALKPNGRLVFSIAHPCFWNLYRRDESEVKFDYWKSHFVVAPFRITLDQVPLPVPTTYFHRPLSTYFSSLRRAGLGVEEVVEPKAPANTPALYRRTYRVPRFVVFSARKHT